MIKLKNIFKNILNEQFANQIPSKEVPEPRSLETVPVNMYHLRKGASNPDGIATAKYVPKTGELLDASDSKVIAALEPGLTPDQVKQLLQRNKLHKGKVLQMFDRMLDKKINGKYLSLNQYDKIYLNKQIDEQDTANAVVDDKAKLIEVLQDKLNSMKTDNQFEAADVAQVIYNNCAHWLNKTGIFDDRSGDAANPKASMAPRVPKVIRVVGHASFERL